MIIDVSKVRSLLSFALVFPGFSLKRSFIRAQSYEASRSQHTNHFVYSSHVNGRDDQTRAHDQYALLPETNLVDLQSNKFLA